MSAVGMIYVCWMNFRPGCDVSQMCDLYNSPARARPLSGRRREVILMKRKGA